MTMRIDEATNPQMDALDDAARSRTAQVEYTEVRPLHQAEK